MDNGRRAGEAQGQGPDPRDPRLDHHVDHVYEELLTYSPLVQPGDYLIGEDTNVNGHPTFPEFGPGPMEAVERFLSQNDDFVIDERCERFMLTLHPRGYLRRKSP